MRSFTMTGPDRSAPRFLGESVGERLILAKLDASAFPLNTIGTIETAAGRVVVAGTLVGRTYTEREAGAAYGPFASGDQDVAVICYDVDLSYTNDADLVPRGVILKENMLPDWSTLSSDAKAAIRGLYVTYQAVA